MLTSLDGEQMQSVVVYELCAICTHTLLSRSRVIRRDLVQMARWMCVVSGGVVVLPFVLKLPEDGIPVPKHVGVE
jgi:hypothetical protein